MAAVLGAVSDARRAQHEMLPVDVEPTDLGALVRGAVADLCAGHNWPAPNVSVSGDVMADADPVRVRQVLASLLSNAYKFSPPGTPVTVTVRAVNGTTELTVHDARPTSRPIVVTSRSASSAGSGRPVRGWGLGSTSRVRSLVRTAVPWSCEMGQARRSR
ncbi:MAG: HAMP domain-containing histidine kinase [Frankiaceae bacterium]|nr:HAMP domain-containing histidine kinase [Frankiaceae bacterium]